MSETSCPERPQLDRFLSGSLDADEAELVAAHTEQCPHCQQQLEKLADELEKLAAEIGGPSLRLLVAASTGEPEPPARFFEQARAALPWHGGATLPHVPSSCPHPPGPFPVAAGGVKRVRARPSLPGYEVLGELGRGGMGVVWKARQHSLNRLVALKMILAGTHAEPQQLARFRAEAETVARLHHPHIVQIYEIGAADGLAYLALELVEGGTLAQQTAGRPQPPRRAAALAATLAQAVHYAHQQGVVHRDLKPANVLLTPGGVPKIADFGLAKRLQGDGPAATGMTTEAGAIVGTPNYMAPEQAAPGGSRRGIGPAADVYALGAILYELLTGRPPFHAESAVDTLVQVIHQEPVPIRVLEPAVPRDLETICLKCLHKDPARRYATAQELAEDLRRFGAGEPIRARRVSEVERAVMWARRRPAVPGLLAIVVLVLLAGILVSTWFGLAESRAARTAQESESAAIEARNQAREAEEDAVTERNRARAAEKAATAAQRAAHLQAAQLIFQQGLQQAEMGAVDRGLFLMLKAWRQTPAEETDFRRIIRTNLAGWSRQLVRLRFAFRGPGGPFYLGDPEGRTVLDEGGGLIRCHDTRTGKPVGEPLPSPAPITQVSPDGRWVVISWNRNNPAFLIDRHARRVVPGVSLPEHWDDNKRFQHLNDVLLEVRSDELLFWELPQGKLLPYRLPRSFGSQDSFSLTRTPQGELAVLVFSDEGGPGERPRVIDLRRGKPFEGGPLTGGPCPLIGYDGLAALQCSPEGAVRRWDLKTGRPIGLPWQPRRAAGCWVSADGLELQVAGGDERWRFYDLATGRQRGGDRQEHAHTVTTPDGRLQLSQSEGTVRVYDTSLCRLQACATAEARSNHVSVPRAFFSPDRSRVLVFFTADVGALLDARTGEILGPPVRHPLLGHAAFSPDGRYLVTATRQSKLAPLVVLRDGRTGKPVGQWTPPRLIWSLAFSPDGKTLAVGCVAGTFLLDIIVARRPEDGSPRLKLRHYLPEETCICGLHFHPDSRRLVTTARDGWSGVGAGLRFWDVWTGQPLSSFRRVKFPVAPPAAWDGDELVYLVRGEYGLHRLSADGKEERGGAWPVGPRLGDMNRHHWVRFSPDGRRLAINVAGKVQQYDTRTGQPAVTAVLREVADCSTYSTDHKLLAVGAQGSLTLFDAEGGWPLGPPLGHGRDNWGPAFYGDYWWPDGSIDRTSDPISLAAFSDGNRTLWTVGGAGVVRSWPVPQPVVDDPERFETWLHARSGRRLEGDELVLLTLEAWQEACRTLQQRWPARDPALTELSDDLSEWHRERALHAAEVGNDRGELYHLGRLAALQPREPLIHARMAAVHARVASRLPEGPARAQQWKLAWAAAKRGMGQPGEDNFNRLRALTAAAGKSWDEALWYLDRLVARHKSDWQLLNDRADLYGQRGDRTRRDADLRKALRLGGARDHGFAVKAADLWAGENRWPEAAAVLREACMGGPADVSLVRRLALALLKAGDRQGHAALCRSLLQSWPANVDANLIAAVLELCALSPDALPDWSGPLVLVGKAVRVVAEAEQAAKDDPSRNLLRELRRSLLTTKGALLHRSGRPGRAVICCQEAMKLTGDGKGGPKEWIWLALAHAAGGKPQRKEAQGWLRQARAAAPKRDGAELWDAVLLEVLVAEAARNADEF